MTLPEILKAFRQWWWILVICPIIAAVTAFFVSSLMTPEYQAESTVIVEHQLAGGSLDLQSIQAAERRTQTFSQLISTRSVIEPVIEELGLDSSVEDVRSELNVSHVQETQLISISFRDEDPEVAATVVNAISDRFGDYVREIQLPVVGIPEEDLAGILANLDEQIADIETQIAELEAGDGPADQGEEDQLVALQGTMGELEQSRSALGTIESTVSEFDASMGSQVYVAEPASPPTEQVSPQVILNVVVAGVLGLMLGGGLTMVAAWVDDNVKTEQDIRRLIDRPVIGTVPMEDLPDQVESIHSGRSISGEIFRGLRTNLQFTMVDRDIKSLVVTSLNPGEGKTTVAANLAIVLAQGGQRVILVDADMRRPRLHSLFHRVRNDRGLSNLLLQSPSMIEDIVQPTTINNLKVIASGPLPPNPTDLLGSSRMKALMTALEDLADIVILDAPPVVISESLLLASRADGLLFVIRSGANRTADVEQGFESLSQTGVPLLGIVLNGVPRESRAAHRIYEQYYPGAEDSADESSKDRPGWLRRVLGRSA